MWDTEMVTIVRLLIADMIEPFKYSDERLQQTILLAAQYVGQEVTFTTTYVVDLDNLTLTPDPTDRDAGTRDDDFIKLVTLKAGCMIDGAEARVAAGQALTIKDGDSLISLGGTGGVLDGRLKLLQVGLCAQYEQAKVDFVYLGYGGVGRAVTTRNCNRYGPCYSYPVDCRYR